MTPSLQAFVIIFVIGALLRAFGLLDKSHAERLASLVFSLSLPATILVSLDRVMLSPEAWLLPLAACLITLPMAACSWQLARLMGLRRAATGGFILATSCINSVYFAFPVILGTFGKDGLARAILFDLGQTSLTLTVLYALAVWYGTERSSTRSVAMRFLSSPPLWALAAILALKLLGLHLPIWIRDLLIPIHLTTTPLASLVLGLSISLAAVRQTARIAVLGVTLRMGGGLFLGYCVSLVLDLTGLERAIVLLVAGMPSAVTAVIFASELGLDEDLVASIVALSICLGVAVLPWLPAIAESLIG